MATPGGLDAFAPALDAAARAEPPADVRVLLVEDSQADAAMIRDLLAAATHTCFQVQTVDRLQSAVDILGRGSVDVVLLDLDVPDGSGAATLHGLSSTHPDTPVVVLSGVVSEARHPLMLDTGAADEVSKDDLMRPRLLVRSLLYAIARNQATQRARSIAALVSADPDAIIVADDSGAVQFVNDAATRLFGLDRHAFVGDLLGFSVGAGHTVEITIMNGPVSRIGEMRVVRIDWMGQPAWLAAIRDTTEQKALTDQLREAQKLEALGLLAGGVAHDFNNFLMIIIGTADLLGERLAGDPRSVEMLGKIQHAADRGAAVNRHLLAFSRRTPVKPVPTDVNGLLRDSIGMLDQLIGDDVELAVDLDAQVGAVIVDPVQFEQVFMNLMVNARDAMPVGGRIEVRTRVVEIRAAQIPGGFSAGPGRFVELSVRDTGEGISETIRQRIFEPFFTTKPKGRGTGLGLSTSHGIVAQAGGFIDVDSELAEGTTFRVCLPSAVAVPAQAATMPDPAPGPVPGGTILLVEDDDDVRLTVRLILEEAGYTILEAVDGQAGLAMHSTYPGPIDLLLSDVVMPRMGGYQLAEALEAERPGLPVLFMSGHPASGDVEHPPGGAWLAKPLRRAELLRAVEQTLTQGRRGPHDDRPVPADLNSR
jgi:two-component system cell cycle sensor histidine kinase/response regulator CckA